MNTLAQPPHPVVVSVLPNALAWLTAVLASSPDGYLLVDPAGVVIEMNMALKQLLGVPPHTSLVGQPAATVLDLLEQQGSRLNAIPAWIGPAPADAVVHYLTLEEPQLRVVRQLTQVVIGAEGSVCGQLWHFQDITPEVRLESLRDTISSFINFHVRCQLSGIHNGLRLLLNWPVGPLNDQQRELLDLCWSSAQQTHRNLATFQEIIRVEQGRSGIDYRPISLKTIVDLAVEQVRNTAQAAEVTVLAALPPELPLVALDQEYMVHVVHYLLERAIKLTPVSETVTLTVQIVDDGSTPRSALIWIEDRGPGISKRDQQHVFKKDVHIPLNVCKGDLELGLAKLVIEAHQGRIWVENAEGQGNRFCFTLPLESGGPRE